VQHREAADRTRAVRRVIWITFVLNVAVAASKIAYGRFADVLAIQADGFHSTTDSVNNIAGLIGIWMASRPPDEGHPYGHHKFEIVASVLVGMSLLAMAYDVVSGAIGRLMGAGTALPRVGAGAFVVLGATLVVNVFVAAYENRRGKELDSAFLISDATHTRSDVLVTLGVLVASVLVDLGYPIFDVLAAGVVAVFIAWAGISVLRHNVGYLADAARVDEERVRVIVLGVPGVAGTHKIRTRGVPGTIYMDLHIQIAPHLDVVQAHEVTHWVVDALKQGIDGVADVTVHTEPAEPGEPYPPLPWDT
jgi:cation diffusion facilitator family transporter